MTDDISNGLRPTVAPTAPLPAISAAIAPRPVSSAALEASRAHTIRVLTDRFADDTISVDEFEAGLDRMYKATSVQEIDALLREVEPRGVRVAAPTAALPGYAEAAPRRVLAIMSSARRVGRWLMPRSMELLAVMSDVTIDLREATFTSGVCELDGISIMADVKILVPPGVIIEELPLNIMANVESDGDDAALLDPAAPRLRITGFALMANIEVRTAPAGLPTKDAWKESKRARRRAAKKR